MKYVLLVLSCTAVYLYVCKNAFSQRKKKDVGYLDLCFVIIIFSCFVPFMAALHKLFQILSSSSVYISHMDSIIIISTELAFHPSNFTPMIALVKGL